MTLAIHCTGCNKAFNIPPDIYERRVAGKIVTLKCKQCGNPIRIDARDEATKAAEPGTAKSEVAKPEIAKPEVAKPEIAKPEVAKPEVAKPEAVAAKKPWASAGGKQPADPQSSKATNPAIPAVGFKAANANKVAENATPQTGEKPVEKPGLTPTTAGKTATGTAAAAKPTATALAAKPTATAAAAKPAATALAAKPTATAAAAAKPAAAATTAATAPKPAEQFASSKKTSLGMPLPAPMTPAAAKPTQLASPKATTEKTPGPLPQSSYRRPTPAASPSAIRASRPPPEDPELPPQMAAAPEAQAKKVPPAAPKRMVAAVKPVAAPPPSPIEPMPSVPPPPSSETPLEALWAVDLPGSDAELPHERLIVAIQQGRVSAKTLVWRIGMTDWQTVESLDELREHLPAPAPPAPPVQKHDLPWMEEPAAVPFEDDDDFDDEPTIAFQNPIAAFESRQKPKPLPPAATPKLAPAPPARSPAVSEESITRTQTDILGHIAQQSVPESQDALRALDALRTLNADHRPMSAPAPIPQASAIAAQSGGRVAKASPIESIRPDFRASGKKKFAIAAVVLLVIGGVVAAIRLSSGDDEAATLTAPVPSSVAAPSSRKKVEGVGEAEAAPTLQAGTPPPNPEVRRNPEPDSTPPPNTPANDGKPSTGAQPGGNDFLSAFSQAAGKADLGGRAPKRFDPADALRAVKARVPFAKHCAAVKGVQGSAQIAVSFAPDGRAVNVQITGEGLNEINHCLTDAMLAARMPAFTGSTSAAKLTVTF